MIIAGRRIGVNHKPYIIAELSANHGGSASEGFKLLQAASDCGATACKIQCYTADSITYPDSKPIMEGPWQGQTLHELYKKAETPPKLVRELFNYAHRSKITLFSSVFDFSGVDLMVELGAPAIKIASFELTDTPLIAYAAKTKLPMIISTGMGTHSEIIDAMNAFYNYSGSLNLAMLHCVSSYPAKPEEANLPALGIISELLGGRHVVGFSDHTLGCGTAAAAVAFGASIIEKHLTIERSAGGVDSAFSLEPSEFARLVVTCNEAYEAIKSRPRVALANLAYRKSLFVVQNVSCGDSFSDKNVRILRPALGIAPRFYACVLAGVATRDLQAGSPLSADMVSTLA